MNIKTATQLVSALAVGVAIILVAAVWLVTSRFHLTNQKQALTEEIMRIAGQRRVIVDNYLRFHRDAYAIEFQVLYDATVHLLEAKQFASAEEVAIIEDMREYNVETKQIFAQAVALYELKGEAQAGLSTTGSPEEKLERRLWILREAILDEANRLGEIARGENAQTLEINTFFVPAAIGMLIFSILAMLLFARVKIVGRLTRLNDDIQMISLGNLEIKVSEGGHDEIGQLARSFNKMMDQLHQFYADQSILASIVAGTYDAVISEDLHGTILSWNPGAEMMLGYSAAEIVGQSVRKILPSDRQDEEEEILARIRRSEVIKAHETIRMRKDGTPIDVSLMISPIRDQRGRIIGASKILRDISESKSQQRALEMSEDALRSLNDTLEQQVAERTAQLESSNRELERFSSAVSHDLRAPLRHLNGFVELLMRRQPEHLDEKSRHYLDVIATASGQMSKLIDDLLSFARMARSELIDARVDMADLVADAIRAIKPELGERDVVFKVGDLPVVRGDRAMLHLALVNLLGNAVKFTRSKPQALIEIGIIPDRNKEHEVAFYIRDNGVGFDMRYQDKLFGIFQRLHSQSEFEGTGIGLANVQRIIQRHGGRIWAESVVQEGATFYFTLASCEGERL